MGRISKGVTAGIVVAASLFLGRAGDVGAQTTSTTIKVTTTTTSTTTTTTLQPHPFSPATASCVRQARAGLRSCRAGGGGGCLTPYLAAFANCFAAPAGASCVTKCNTKYTTCLGAAPTVRANCKKACTATRKNDGIACKRIAVGDTIWATGDAGCLGTARSNYLLCTDVCTQAVADCRIAFVFCYADCPNL